MGPMTVEGFDAVPRLFLSTFRLVLLMLIAGIAYVVARGSVDGSAQRASDNAPKALLVGLAAELLFAPVLALTAVLLAVSIIGIPLILLLPFAVLVLILLALAGFTGTAAAIGQAARRRFGLAGEQGFLDVVLGVLIILSPVLIGRMLALASWPDNPFTWVLILTGTGFEFLAWTTGFGAVLMNTFSRWRARRVARASAAPCGGNPEPDPDCSAGSGGSLARHAEPTHPSLERFAELGRASLHSARNASTGSIRIARRAGR